MLALPGLGAWDAERLVGVATYAIDGDRAELAALAVSTATPAARATAAA